MFQKIFQAFGPSIKELSCEKTGDACSLSDTKLLTRVNALITTKHMRSPRVIVDEKRIYSDNKPPISYYSKMCLPAAFESALGEIYCSIADEDDPEQTTALLAERGQNLTLVPQIMKFASYLENNDRIEFPDTIFCLNVSDTDMGQTNNVCKCCNSSYFAVNDKYRFKKIVEIKEQPAEFGYMAVILPGFDIGVSDVSDKNIKGHYYFLKTDKVFNKVNLCSNECAVEFCKKNKVVIYFNDFLNGGKLRILLEQTPEINQSIKNSYKYRSSNL